MTTTPIAATNGAASAARKKSSPGATMHRSLPVLDMKAGDALPTPPVATLYAIRVYPDLARHLLTFNPPNNRSLKAMKWKQYARDMAAGRWVWNTVQTVAFSDRLENGQNTLMAVTEYGEAIWLPVWFGVPSGLMAVLDRGAARTNADAARMEDIPNPNVIAAAINIWHRFNDTMATERTWATVVPLTSGEMLHVYQQDPDGWQDAGRVGARLYAALDRGLTPSVWAGMYRAIRDVHPERVEAFFLEVHDGTGDPRSSSRMLRDWFMRRPVTVTRTGDKREPYELIVRAFNAWLGGKRYSNVQQVGFTLSRVRR